MKLEMFHLMPYRELPEDFREQYHSVWVDVPAGIDTTDALPAAAEQGVAYVRGADFFISEGGRSSLRLAFSACATDQIGAGIGRLAEVLGSRRAAAVA